MYKIDIYFIVLTVFLFTLYFVHPVVLGGLYDPTGMYYSAA